MARKTPVSEPFLHRYLKPVLLLSLIPSLPMMCASDEVKHLHKNDRFEFSSFD